jgi:quinol monooxygenase YgiN
MGGQGRTSRSRGGHPAPHGRGGESEPGTLLFWPHRSSSDGRVFFLYELFVDDAAFAAHQQTDHFKKLVVGEALPKLARRERVQIKPFRPQGPEPFAE